MGTELQFGDLPMTSTSRVLVFGYGNIGRQDDGLGIQFAEGISPFSKHCGVKTEANYQLNIEDALLIADFDVVIFADATLNKTSRPYALRQLSPALDIGITTHAMSPASVLALCQTLYNQHPACYLLSIPGESWEINEGLSRKAQNNLQAALGDFAKTMTSLNSQNSADYDEFMHSLTNVEARAHGAEFNE